jgi:co-chaperonin GroES (HSP10)
MADKLLVRPLDWEASSVIIAIREGRPLRGVVVSAGPGTYPNKYSPDRSKTWKSKVFVPTTVKVGDIVNIGGLHAYDGKGFVFPEVIVDGIKHIIIQEADVAAIEEE